MVWVVIGAMAVALVAVVVMLVAQRDCTRVWQRMAIEEIKRTSQATSALYDMVLAFEAWGREGDGVPEEAVAYNRARELLGMPPVPGRTDEEARHRAKVVAEAQARGRA